MQSDPASDARQTMRAVARRPCFVFAVCGGASHVRELHEALAALRRHSRADILVVTDSRRNEIPIDWPDAIDAAAPPHFDHHQASIYLKTRVHRLLPTGRRYCYLDSDVFATGPAVDEVFSAATTPVAFAADSVRLHQFSPYAVRCGCTETNAAERAGLEGVLAAAYRTCYATHCPPKTGWSAAEYDSKASSPLARLGAYLRHRVTTASASQRGDDDATKWRSFWYEYHDKAMRQPECIVRFVEKSSGWRRDRRRQSWISPAGNDVYHPGCDHLAAAIEETFGISVTHPRWQHWNGGVFLFDERGHAFLDAWHEKTMHIFGLPGWRTRDQGTLVATAWEFGLQDQPVLPSRFNCILDPHAGATMVTKAGDALTTDAFLTTVRPALAHVLRSGSDPTWDVWRWVRAHAFAQ